MLLEHTTATLTPTVPTPKDLSTAHVIRDTLETELRVLVNKQITRHSFTSDWKISVTFVISLRLNSDVSSSIHCTCLKQRCLIVMFLIIYMQM